MEWMLVFEAAVVRVEWMLVFEAAVASYMKIDVPEYTWVKWWRERIVILS